MHWQRHRGHSSVSVLWWTAHIDHSYPTEGALTLGMAIHPATPVPLTRLPLGIELLPCPTSRSAGQAFLRDQGISKQNKKRKSCNNNNRNLFQGVQREKSLASTDTRGGKQGRGGLRDDVRLPIRMLSSATLPGCISSSAMGWKCSVTHKAYAIFKL